MKKIVIKIILGVIIVFGGVYLFILLMALMSSASHVILENDTQETIMVDAGFINRDGQERKGSDYKEIVSSEIGEWRGVDDEFLSRFYAFEDGIEKEYCPVLQEVSKFEELSNLLLLKGNLEYYRWSKNRAALGGYGCEPLGEL